MVMGCILLGIIVNFAARLTYIKFCLVQLTVRLLYRGLRLYCCTWTKLIINNYWKDELSILGHLRRWPNKPGKNVHLSVRTSTIKHNAATNQIVIFVKVDETFTMIWLSMSSEVRVKVTWDLVSKMTIFKFCLRHFSTNQKIQQFLILDQNI